MRNEEMWGIDEACPRLLSAKAAKECTTEWLGAQRKSRRNYIPTDSLAFFALKAHQDNLLALFKALTTDSRV